MSSTSFPVKSSQNDEIVALDRQAKSSSTLKDREDAWMSIAETTVLAFAFWLDPTAGAATFFLKLCFQLLRTLRHHHRK